ncbi:hypothetical protein [Streptomyces sp. LN500]|uniref:hypothetical protein n=1 Tax=Streptomyces sp. LN500 TaxID=3112978 RepID=UPI00371185B6
MGTHTSRGDPHRTVGVTHPLRLVAFLVAALCTLVMALTATARSTVVSPLCHQAVLDDERAYDRRSRGGRHAQRNVSRSGPPTRRPSSAHDECGAQRPG